MSWLQTLLIKIFGILTLIFTGNRLGRVSNQKKQAEKKIKELEKDVEISSRPYVDNPFGKLRSKDE